MRIAISRPRQRGVALLEVLIAILIFSFGILELTRLQSAMTRAQGSAKFRADAVNLADDVVGLIWTDRPGLLQYDQASCASYARCADWQRKVASTLPGGQGQVVASASGDVKVTVSWALSAEGRHSYVLETTLGF